MIVSVAARMEAFGQPSTREMIEIENISCWGARVVSGRLWKVNDHVVISDYVVGVCADAQVVYCQSLNDGRFAYGLKFRESLVDSMAAFSLD
jgi:hypothetical protein